VVESGVVPDGVVEVVDRASHSLHAVATRVEGGASDNLELIVLKNVFRNALTMALILLDHMSA
jgi:hypothetical protein